MVNHETRISATLEDYLEVIFQIIEQEGAARVRDISRRVGVHKSTVTAALHTLAEKKLIHYAPYEAATLTAAGKQIASDVIRRHAAIERFLVEVLNVDPLSAEENACRIEHAADPNVIDRLLKFADFTERCPRVGAKWIEHLGYFCDGPGGSPRCTRCMEMNLETYCKGVADARPPNADARPTKAAGSGKPGPRN